MKRVLLTLLLCIGLCTSVQAQVTLDNVKNGSIAGVSTGYNSVVTTIVVNTGHGVRLPTPPFRCTWWNTTDYGRAFLDANVEVIRVIGLSTDTLTIQRAQEGTTANTHNTAGKTYQLDCGFTAGLYGAIQTELAAVRGVAGGGTGLSSAGTSGNFLKSTGSAFVSAALAYSDFSNLPIVINSLSAGTTLSVRNSFYEMNCSSPCTVVLATAAAHPGETYTFLVLTGSSTVTLDGSGSENICDSTSCATTKAYTARQVVTLVSNSAGTAWYVLP